MQPRERQFHLRLHARCARHPASRTRRAPGQVVQQHRLAHARVAVYYQDPALTAPDGVDEPVELGALAEPIRQHRRTAPPPPGICAHWPTIYRVVVAWRGVVVTRPPG